VQQTTEPATSHLDAPGFNVRFVEYCCRWKPKE
jgi:hypothetical protein